MNDQPTGLEKAASEESARVYGALCREHVSDARRRAETDVELIVELAKRMTA